MEKLLRMMVETLFVGGSVPPSIIISFFDALPRPWADPEHAYCIDTRTAACASSVKIIVMKCVDCITRAVKHYALDSTVTVSDLPIQAHLHLTSLIKIA